MESILLIIESWWWVAPVAVGAGSATYAGLTTRSRRARRLELDGARHEEALAFRALAAARVRVSDAQADVHSARASSPAPSLSTALIGTTEMNESKRRLQEAKRAEKSAALTLRATRTRVKATRITYHAASASDPLPIDRLFAAHDAVIGRWMAYETDIAKAIAYPRLTDPNQPATIAFLRRQREAQRLRPGSARDRIPPEQYTDYRAAVRALESAFDEAERHAGAAPPRDAPPTGIWSIPGWRPRPPLSS